MIVTTFFFIISTVFSVLVIFPASQVLLTLKKKQGRKVAVIYNSMVIPRTPFIFQTLEWKFWELI